MPQVTPRAQQLADEIKALSLPDRLRLAASLLENGHSATAIPIVQEAAHMLSLSRA